MTKFGIFTTICFYVFISSCWPMARTMMGRTESNLLEKISFNTGCPVDSILVMDRNRGRLNDTYKLDVCGQSKMYKIGGYVGDEIEEVK